jgi:3-oxoadipate enol-lactonase
MEKINVNGITLAYIRRGTGTPLALIHGYPLDHSIWDQIAPVLEDKYDLIIPDLRGFGESSTVDEQYSLDDMASDLAGLFDQLGIDKVALAGHSMGGYLALAFARLYPNRLRGLGLVSSQALADAPDRKEGRYKTAAEVAEKGVGVVVEAMTPKLSPATSVQDCLRGLIEKQKPAGVIGALKAMAERRDSTALLTEFQFTVVLVHGDLDALILLERAREVKTLLPAAKLLELAGVGHMPMMEAPRETAWALKHLT